MNLIELKHELQQPYDRTAWQTVLRETFPNVSIFTQPHTVLCENQDVSSFLELGSVRLHDDKKLAIFEIVLTPKKKIQRNRVELRNLVAKYIDQETNHGVLVIFTGQNEDYRFTFTAKESEFNDDGEFVERQTATKRFTYLLGPHETCTTAARRLSQLAGKLDNATLADVVEAFSVEKLNKEFFTLYKEHYTTFVNHLLSGDAPQKVFAIPRLVDEMDQDKANKPVRDFAKRLLGRLVFLYFIQKKGWLGCPADRTDWTEGDRSFVRNLFLTCPDKGKFYSTRLAPLFFEALNRPNRPNALFPATGTRVPYLNGGLFEHEKLPNDHKPLPVEKLDFPATLFEQVLEFFGQYNFTIDENDPDDHEVGIDPEMLGHIFENLLEDNKDKGVYYTPKPIVHHMCQQSLIHYLQLHLDEREEIVSLVRFKDAGSAIDKNNWVRQNAKRIEELLDRLKICDPAIGSGAFPIGLLQEIYWIKLTLDWTLDPAETKLKIIQNSIYGVDIDAGAVEIARLRFWLSLIVDEEEPHPLPNLDYKIMQGDSLLESFEGIPLDKLHQAKGYKVEVFSKQGQGQMFPGELLEFSQSHEGVAKAKEIKTLINRYFGETNPSEKQELHRKIDRFVLDHIDYNLQIQEEKICDELQLRKAEIKRKAGLVKGWKPPKKDALRIVSLEEELKSIALKKAKLQELEEKPERPYFLWHLFFQDVFEQGGFDIVIANPPYVRHEVIKHYKPLLEPHYECFTGTADLFVYFYEKAIRLLNDRGVLTFISSNKYFRSAYGVKLREFISSQLVIQQMLDFGDAPVFEAIAYASILIGIKGECTTVHHLKAYNWQLHDVINKVTDVFTSSAFSLAQNELTPNGWQLELETVHNLLEKLRSKGTPLGEFMKGHFFYGIKTGYNKAFVVDRSTRDKLIAEDSRSGEILKPYLRGKDVKRWRPYPQDLWLIFSRRGIVIDDFPAIKRHLLQFKENLEPKPKNWPSGHPWLGRKAGTYKWYELQDSIDYWEQFETSKIILGRFMNKAEYCYDIQGHYHNDALYIIGDARPSLAAILNSNVTWWYLLQTCTDLQNGYIQALIQNQESIPIPAINNSVEAELSELALSAAKAAGSELAKIEHTINTIVYKLFDLNPEDLSLIEQRVTFQEAPGGLDNKSSLITRILPAIKELSAYFHLKAVKRALANVEIEVSDDTLREYMSEAMASGIISDAGRGWYSRHEKPVSLDPKPIAKIIRVVKKEFPLLDFCCWSTIQFNPFAQHLIAQPTIFLYAESDTLNTVAEKLKENGWDAWADPGKNEVERYIRPGDRTVILRPSIQKQPESKDQVAPIEKALVDLKIEASRLQLMDSAEVQRIIDTVLSSGLLQLTALLGYSEVKREKIESTELSH
ncbi:MAG: Eco57I restriction-modification methylase domain-containing protein [Desulfuromonadaceae bacterium]|nr:Eco57I restriction-modification methylase domain-containing protein [Desulfuromonadaceae bacterium]